MTSPSHIGFACAYTPTVLIEAAGFTPFRLLPMGQRDDQAGRLLHDNLCPHVKQIISMAMAGDHPDLAGMVFVNSCDAMRRAADAWHRARPGDRIILIDLPATDDDTAVRFLAAELRRLADALTDWSGRPIDLDRTNATIDLFNRLCRRLDQCRNDCACGHLDGGRAALQSFYNTAVTHTAAESLALIEARAQPRPGDTVQSDRVPVFVFGNVMPDPGAFELIESCGARIVGDDLCTAGRMFQPLPAVAPENGIWADLAAALLRRPPCARTFSPAAPGRIADQTISAARDSGAKGVIGYTLKFCDPYLARVPMIRQAFKAADLPLLVLEGDCTLGALGQQRTRIEAFVEMLR